MMKTIRDAHFVPYWIDMEPEVPVPRTDWIQLQYLDLAYGPGALQTLDLYLPESGTGPLPVVVLVHGGGFCACDKRDWHLYPGFYALQKGFALASVNYRLTPEVKFPTPVEDIKAAVRFLRVHAHEYGLCEKELFLYGTSAGGNLVALAGLQNAGMPEAVQGVAALCPILDFEDQWHYLSGLPKDNPMRGMLEAAAVQYLGNTPEQIPELAQRAGAFASITAQAPAFYLQHGTQDLAIPVEQTRNFARALQQTGMKQPVVLDILEGAAHAGGGPEFLEEEHIAPIFDFFLEQCKKEKEL